MNCLLPKNCMDRSGWLCPSSVVWLRLSIRVVVYHLLLYFAVTPCCCVLQDMLSWVTVEYGLRKGLLPSFLAKHLLGGCNCGACVVWPES